MNEIEFLPADYVCVKTKRNESNWLRVLFAVVLTLIAIGWGAQRNSILELTARRNRMHEQATLLLSKLDSSETLQTELNRLKNETRLVDALRSNIPPSRWLQAIVNLLPSQTVVSEIRAEFDDGTESPRQSMTAGAPPKTDEKTIGDPVEKDLARLTRLVPRQSLRISLRGTAADDLEVSQFLNALHQNDLFEHVQLLFTDQKAQKDRQIRSFAIRLRTQPLGVRFSQQKQDPAPIGAVAVRPKGVTDIENER